MSGLREDSPGRSAWRACVLHGTLSVVTCEQDQACGEQYSGDVKSVLLTEEQIRAKTQELGAAIGEKYRDIEGDLLLVTVLKGAVMFVSDLARAIPIPTQMEFMAVSSYGSATSSSGVVRILKDLDRDIQNLDVLIVEDIIDSGLTLSWLMRNLASRDRARSTWSRCCASPRPRRSTWTWPSSDSRFRTSSSSVMDSITASGTAICPLSARCTHGSTPTSPAPTQR